MLPDVGSVLAPPDPVLADPLSEAWADGEPARACAWMAGSPPSLERDAAIALTRAASARRDGPSGELATALWVLAERAARGEGDAPPRPSLSGALGIVAGATMLHHGALDAALEVANAQMALATARRNGAWLAAAALLAVDAHLGRGEIDQAAAVRYQAAKATWHMGARAALSLLLRVPISRSDEPT